MSCQGPSWLQVVWAEGEGRDSIRGVYVRSATLNGDAVVVFVRALCAVSQACRPECLCTTARLQLADRLHVLPASQLEDLSREKTLAVPEAVLILQTT